MASNSLSPDDAISTWPVPLRTASRLEWLTFGAVFLAPIVYLSVRHGIHVSFYVLALLAAFQLSKDRRIVRDALAAPWNRWLLISFASLFGAVALTQVLRFSFFLPAFDSPSKLLIAALVFLYLRGRAIAFARVLEISLPLGLIAVYAVLQLYPDTSTVWDGPFATGRYATRFVDPNSLGSQSLILTLLCVFSIGLFGKEKPWLLLLKVCGAIIGFYVAINAQSRGGWLAFPALLMLWLVLFFGRDDVRGYKRVLIPAGVVCIAAAVMIVGYEYSSIVFNRGHFAVEQFSDWLTGKNLEGPVGVRLSMWKISFALAGDSPWIGYGKVDIQSLMGNHLLNIPAYRSAIDTLAFAGPHSDFFAKLLSMGLVGVLAYLLTLAVPWIFFWTRRTDANAGTRAASHIGLYFVTGILVCGLTNEMLSLKYLCSFFGLMIAGLASDVAKRAR